MSRLEDWNDFNDFYGFYDFYDLPFTVHRLRFNYLTNQLIF
jgi:hypothetical protein